MLAPPGDVRYSAGPSGALAGVGAGELRRTLFVIPAGYKRAPTLRPPRAALPCLMDSGWAALIGAVVGAVVSTCVPWLREALTEGRRREQIRREKLADALAELLSLLALQFSGATDAPEDVAKFELASARFALLTRPTEKPLVDTLVTVAYTLGSEDANVRGGAYVTFLDVAIRWHQGTLTAAEAAAKYTEKAPVFEKTNEETS
jgi:hypothetical protein